MKTKHTHAAHRASRCLSLILTLAMLVSLFAAMLPTANAADEPAAELTIATLDDLKALSAAVDDGNTYAGKTVVLAADIDASAENWNPIGSCTSSTEFAAFAGTFDGQGHTVTLKIESPAEKYLGLFAYNSGTIRNVTVRGSISGKGYLGGICGYNAGTISGCTNYATISGTDAWVGGITGCGKASVSKIENCANYGAIETTIASGNAAYAGGIIGQALASTSIIACYNAGTVTSNKGYTGGVAGYAMSTIQDCYNIGAVSSSVTGTTKTIGGIAGALMGSGTITNCYNVGTVTAMNAGAIAGMAYNGKFTNCYYLESSADYGICSLSSATGKMTADEMRAAAFAAALGSAFKTVENDYPALTWQETSVTPHAHSYTVSETTAATCTEPGVITYTCACGDSYTEEISAPGHDLSYKDLLDGTHEERCSRCDFYDLVACTYVNGVCICGAKEPEEVIPDCRVSLKIGISTATFSVPYGKTLNITWQFIDRDSVPYGWQMLVNGEIPTASETIDGVTVISLPTMAAVCTSGKPADVTFTPTREQCLAGETVMCNVEVTPLTDEACEFDILFVEKTTGEQIGQYEENGAGYHASKTYGKFTISATKTTTIANWVTMHLDGYRLYMGTNGNVDTQEQTLLVGENGVDPKCVTMYVEVNHSTLSPLHTQKVQFKDGETVVLETAVPLKHNWTGSYPGAIDTIELDLTAAEEQLTALGYAFDRTQTCTVDCDNYTHDPAVTVIELVKKNVFPFEYTIENDVVTITKYIGENTVVDVPATIEGRPVVALGLGAFSKNDGITEVGLPASVISIGQAAFSGCTKLEKINLQQVTSFGPYAFLGCESLTEVVFNDEIATLPVYLFSECSSLTKVHLPEKLTALSNHLFDACESLTTLEIPESVTIIDRCAFEEAGLIEIVIPDSVASIGDYAFDGCAKLERITLGTGLETLGDLVFWKCVSLKSIVIPEKVAVIPTGTFLDCTALESVTVGRSVTALEPNAFKNSPAAIHGYADSAAFTYARDNAIPFVCIEHVYGSWTVTKEAGCTEPGIETRVCSCGEAETREVPALGHKTELKNAKAATCTEAGYTGDEVCTVCGETVKKGEVIAALGHKWDDGKVTTEPTAREDGVRTFTCTACGATRTEAIPATGAEPVDPATIFIDVTHNWAYEGISYCYNNGLMVGLTDTVFGTNDPVTRGQLVTILWRQAGEPKATKTCPFTDLTMNYYRDAIAWAAEVGVAAGRDATYFDPDAAVSRQEMTAFFYRYAENVLDLDMSKTADLSAFPDADSSSNYAKGSMAWAVAEGLISGDKTSDGIILDPLGTATRAQVATVFMNFCEIVLK